MATGLPAGAYTVKISKTGFQTYLERALAVGSAETRVVNAVLAVGDVSKQIEVNATATQVQTATSEMASVVAAQQVANLPLNGRNYTGLATLMPGVVNLSAGSSLGTGGFSTSNTISVNGMGLAAGTTYFLDGIWNENTGNSKQMSDIELVTTLLWVSRTGVLLLPGCWSARRRFPIVPAAE